MSFFAQPGGIVLDISQPDLGEAGQAVPLGNGQEHTLQTKYVKGTAIQFDQLGNACGRFCTSIELFTAEKTACGQNASVGDSALSDTNLPA